VISKRFAGALLLAAVLAAGGCAEYKPIYSEVEGKVTIDGEPAPGVEVTFFPVQGQAQGFPLASGRADAEGKYRLSTADGQKGALTGPHRVVVGWPGRDRGDADRDKAPPTKPPFAIPLRYTVASKTPLLVEVKPGGPQTIDLELER
jgi:hypothetical protein